jgi:hypothetical protein
MSKLKTTIIAGVLALLLEAICLLFFMGLGVVGPVFSWVAIIYWYPAMFCSRWCGDFSFAVFLIVGFLQPFVILWFIFRKYGRHAA